MRKSNRKNITLDDLAIMVGNGFSDVDKQFKAIDARFNAMDARFDAMDARFDCVDERLDSVEVRLGHVEKEVLGLKTEFGKMGDRFVARYEFDTLLTRVIRLEQKVEKNIK